MSCRNRRGVNDVDVGSSADGGVVQITGELPATNDVADCGDTISTALLEKKQRNVDLIAAEICTIDAISSGSKVPVISIDELSDTTSVSDDTPPSTPSSHGSSERRRSRRRKLNIQDSHVSSSSSPARDEHSKRHKRNMIVKALSATPPDVATLRQLAISRGGLLDDSLRKRAWPCLLDIDVGSIPPKPDVETLHSHRDYEQVILDVKRSMKRFPPGMLEEVRMSYQDQLIDCIMWVLVSHPDLHYYQGFHDIVVTFLLVVGEDLTFAIMDKLCQNHLRDFMEVTMEKTNYILHYLLPLIGKASPTLRNFMEQSEVGTMFCLSWLITWYGHVLSEFRHIVRLYDFFMACHPLMPIYLAADIVLYREKDVLSCICEMPFVHSLLSKIPDDLPFELLITQAGDLFIQYPPNVLEHEARIQYERFVEEIQRRRDEGAARRAAAASRQRLPTKSTNQHEANVLVRVTTWTLVGAVSFVAFALMRTGRFEWPSWWWWLWTSPTQPSGLGT